MRAAARPERSTFVSVVAWVFIGLSAMTTLIGIVQNLMIHTLFPLDDMRTQVNDPAAAEHLPWFAAMMFEYFPWFFGALLGIAIFTLAASIGLLLRHNWARLVFIAIMVLGIVWNIASVGIQLSIMDSMLAFPAPDDPEFDRWFGIIQYVIIGFAVVFALAFSGLFGWIAWKLRTPQIVSEFRTSGRDR